MFIMRAVAISVMVFALLAFDLAGNNGRLLECATDFGHAILREVGL